MYELISHLRPFGRRQEELGGRLGGGRSSWEEYEGGRRRLCEENVEQVPGCFFSTNCLLSFLLTVLLEQNFDVAIDSSADLENRNITPYLHPGGFVWKDVLKNSPIKANQELSSRLVIPEDWDAQEVLTLEALEKGTFAKLDKSFVFHFYRLDNGLSKKEKLISIWYQSKTTPLTTRYSGYVTDKKWKLNEAILENL